MTTEFHTEYQKEIVCPYCGYEYHCSYEITRDHESGDYKCEECNKDFRWQEHREVSYSTEKIDERD